MRAIQRVLMGVGAMAPAAAWASGDPAVVWGYLGGVVVYPLVGLVLLFGLWKRVVGIGRVALFAGAAAVSWYLYLGSLPVPVGLLIVSMLVVPLLFLLGIRWKSAS